MTELNKDTIDIEINESRPHNKKSRKKGQKVDSTSNKPVKSTTPVKSKRTNRDLSTVKRVNNVKYI
jgi:hypothetical protein